MGRSIETLQISDLVYVNATAFQRWFSCGKTKSLFVLVTYLVHPKKIIFLQWKCILDTKVTYVSLLNVKEELKRRYFSNHSVYVVVFLFLFTNMENRVFEAALVQMW